MKLLEYLPFFVTALVVTVIISVIAVTYLHSVIKLTVVSFEQWMVHVTECGLIYPCVLIYAFVGIRALI